MTPNEIVEAAKATNFDRAMDAEEALLGHVRRKNPGVKIERLSDGPLEQRENLTDLLADLPAHYREVLVMSYFHQFAYREMADMLRIPLGTVKSRLHAALAAFAKAYKEAVPAASEN